MNKTNILVTLTTLLAAGALVVALNKTGTTQTSNQTSTLDQVKQTKTLRVAAITYDPYMIKDPTTGKYTGYSVDMAEYIAKEAGWKVEYVETNFDTMIPDLQTGKYDLMTLPIYRTIPRAAQVSFTRPYAYFGYSSGLVRKGDHRFTKIEDLNNPNVTIAVRLGYTDQQYAVENLPKAKLKAMNVTDTSEVFADILAGNSDIALADTLQLSNYAKAHPQEVDALWVENPPAFVPAGFMVRQNDFSLNNFLNTSLDYMESNKVFTSLDQKYHLIDPHTLVTK